MGRRRLAALVLFGALAQLRAAEPVRKTPFSINEPCEIPSMILEPGQYVFRLMEREPQRNVLDVFETVQLWTGDETRLLSTLLTMPNYDLPTTDKTVFTFFERGPKQAKALRIWFAPGRNYGQEFLYPKLQAVELAKSVGRAVLSLPPELPGDLGKLAAAPPQPIPASQAPAAVAPPVKPVVLRPVPAQKVAELQRSVAENRLPATAPSSFPIQSRARVTSEPRLLAASLPKTASSAAVLAVLGLLGIAGGVLLRILALKLERS